MLKLKNILLLLLVALLFFAAASSVAAQETEGSRFARVISEYTNIFNYSGQVQHEHQYNYYNGMAGVVAAGRGTLGGTHHGWSLTPGPGSVLLPLAASLQNYHAKTAAGARPADYMRIIGGFSLRQSHSARSGVEVAPGAQGYVKDEVAVSSGEGGYFEHSNITGTTNGKTKVESSIEGTSSTSVEVSGYAMFYEQTVIDGGGQKTGWWDPHFSGEGSQW